MANADPAHDASNGPVHPVPTRRRGLGFFDDIDTSSGQLAVFFVAPSHQV